MRAFIYKVVFFAVILISLLWISLYGIKNGLAEKNILAALNDKHQLLKSLKGEKIILAGGSNLSFGLNSEKISKYFKKPAINMGIHAGMGLKFIANDIKPFINKGDIVVLVPEYENFYTDNFYGEMELVYVLFDIYPEGRNCIDSRQWMKLFKYLPAYSAKKIKSCYKNFLEKNEKDVIDIYHRRSFNAYGDACIHWKSEGQDFPPLKKPRSAELNPEVITFLKEFEKFVTGRGARVILLAPALEKRSYKNTEQLIGQLDSALKKAGFPFYSDPERYAFTKENFYNTYYHLNKKGADLRTERVINDLKSYLEIQ